MANPFQYFKKPETVKEAQSNVNYWFYEGFLTTEEMEELGHIPANYRSFIKAMTHEAKTDLAKLKG